MGSTWQERFKTQNLEVANFTLPTLMSWFKKQEEVAQANIKRNDDAMRLRAKSTKEKSSSSRSERYGCSLNKRKCDAEDPPASARKKINDDDHCPIHPGAGHTWGECYSNVKNYEANKRRREAWKQKKNNKGKKDEQFAVEVSATHQEPIVVDCGIACDNEIYEFESANVINGSLNDLSLGDSAS
jgi:hypothetical protein